MKIINTGQIKHNEGKTFFIGWQIDCEGEPVDLDTIKKSIYAYLEAHNE